MSLSIRDARVSDLAGNRPSKGHRRQRAGARWAGVGPDWRLLNAKLSRRMMKREAFSSPDVGVRKTCPGVSYDSSQRRDNKITATGKTARAAPTRTLPQILYTKLTQGAPRRRRTPGQCTSRDRARARFLGRVVVVPEIRARELEALRELRRQPRLDLQDPIPVLLHFSPIGRQDPFDLLTT